MRRSTSVATDLERLEPRVLLAFAAHINFQPSSAAVPGGYFADGGQTFASRNGLSYGWSTNNTPNTTDRNSSLSPDQRYDTFIQMQKNSNGKSKGTWEIAVPNGSYSVHLVAGDPSATDSTYKMNVEGALVINGTPTSANHWIENTSTISVTDGRLTLANASGAVNNKVCFIDITMLGPVVTLSSTDTSASESGDTATFNVSRTGSTSAALTVAYAISGNATNGTDYNTLSGSVTIPAGASSAAITVTPIADTAVETTETVTLTLQASNNYVISTPSAGTANIADVPTTGNHPPAAPVIIEPLTEGEQISGADVHMETGPFSDPDSGDTHLSSDWEIWTIGASPVRVWSALGVTDAESKVHIHLGNGTFEGPLAGQIALSPDTDYELRARHRDSSGDAATNTSATSLRHFHTLPAETPTAPGWVVQQPGYRVEEVPFTFASGELQWRLPTNITFVPDSVRGPHPLDPLFYVTELYGTIRVVTNNYTVYTYAGGVLNYNPLGPISGTGENGLAGIAVDPTNGDVYVTMLWDDLTDATADTFPKITRYTSTDGGLHAVDTNSGESGTQGTDILKMPGESMHQSHIISNLTFGPDGKLWSHLGDGFEPTTSRDDQRFKGKILHLNRDGTPSSDNPHYNPADGITAFDYWWAEGLRNPFGGAWRDADAGVSRPAQHFTVENGPSIDRFSLLIKNRDYLYDGTDASMLNYNIAYSSSGTFENGAPDWNPAAAPVNIAFIQNSNFAGSQFPADKQGHAFVTLSGYTHAAGPNAFKSIQEWVLNNDGTRHVSTDGSQNPRELISYEGSGYSTAAALAAGPDGLYFSTLYPDIDPTATNRGAKIFRVIYVGTAPAAAAAVTRPSQFVGPLPVNWKTLFGSATVQQKHRAVDVGALVG